MRDQSFRVSRWKMVDRKMEDQIMEREIQRRSFDLSQQQKHGVEHVEQLTTSISKATHVSAVER